MSWREWFKRGVLVHEQGNIYHTILSPEMLEEMYQMFKNRLEDELAAEAFHGEPE